MFFYKSRKKIILIGFCLLFIIVGLRFISHVTFNSANPIIAGIGLVKIYILGVEYVIVKEEPQLIITKPKDSLNRLVKFMNDQGYIFIEELGATVVFENNISEKIFINMNVNRYCSRWVWN